MDNFYSHICSIINDNFSFDGEKLCHYTSPKALVNILENKSLRFTDYRFLNDKTEGTYIYDVINSLDLSVYDERFIRAIESLKKRRFTISEIVSERLSHIPNEGTYKIDTSYFYFICSFSADCNNLAMWNYYTKTASGVGYNIVLYTKDLQENFSKSLSIASTKNTLFFKKVIYDEETQKSIIKTILDGYYGEWLKHGNHELLEENLYKTIDEVRMCFKNPCFALENEIRMIVKISYYEYMKILKSDGIIKINDKDGYFVPYMDLCFGETEDLARVTISPKGEYPFVNQSVRILLEKFGYRNAEIINSKIPLR